MMKIRKHYKSIDIAKFIAAIMIIMLHVNPFADISSALTWINRDVFTPISIPFFFVASGFLLSQIYAASDNIKGKCKKRVVSILKLYLKWTLIYLPFVLIDWSIDGFSVNELLQYLKRCIFEGSYSTIWFLPALAVGTTICTVVYYISNRKLGVMLGSAAVIYLITVFGTNMLGFSNGVAPLKMVYSGYYSFFESMKNGVFYAYPLITIGFIISKKQDSFKWKTATPFLAGAISWGLLAVESFLQTKLKWNSGGVDSGFFLPVVVLFIFLAVLHIEKKSFSEEKCELLRNMSILMFLTQRIFITLGRYAGLDQTLHSFLWFLATLVCTMLFSLLIIVLSKRYRVFEKLYR